jgi:hypothetical protein
MRGRIGQAVNTSLMKRVVMKIDARFSEELFCSDGKKDKKIDKKLRLPLAIFLLSYAISRRSHSPFTPCQTC